MQTETQNYVAAESPMPVEEEFTKTIERYTSAIPSAAYLGVAVGAMGVSLLAQVSGRGKWGNFIAQWVPTWLIIGLYNKLVKLEGHDRRETGARASHSPAGSMKLKDFINYRVEAVQPTDTLQAAAEKMSRLDVGAMPVCEDHHLVGVITDRDITIRATAKGQDPKTTQVSEAMTPEVVYCFETQGVHEAAELMQEHQIRRLFVVNDEEELVGVTSLGELATVTGDSDISGKTLERISEPAESTAQEEPEGSTAIR